LALRASKKAALQPGAQASGEWRRLFAARLEESGAPAWSTSERRVAAPVRGRVAAPHSVLRRRAGCGGGARVWRLRAYLRWPGRASSPVATAELLLDGSAQRPVEAAASLEAVEAGE